MCLQVLRRFLDLLSLLLVRVLPEAKQEEDEEQKKRKAKQSDLLHQADKSMPFPLFNGSGRPKRPSFPYEAEAFHSTLKIEGIFWFDR